MKLNMGCGRHVLEGWVNIDAQISKKAKRPPEHICDLRQVPLPDNCATEIMAIHVFEHFYYWEVQDVIKEWHRLLCKEGRLILELPDMLKCCRNILENYGVEEGAKHPHQMGLWGLYGDPQSRDPYMHHRWGWSPASLRALLRAHGFIDVKEEETQWHKVGKERRDMRITAVKS